MCIQRGCFQSMYTKCSAVYFELFIFSNSIGKLLAKDIAFGILNRRVSDPSIREEKTRIWKGLLLEFGQIQITWM
uniref:Indole-3-acetic acid amido synthetase n=1 Tax=Solanum tuberosum TaxID=4113 RepID=M1AZW3_SOLTU